MNKLRKLFDELTSNEGSLFIYSLSFSLLLAIAPAITIFVAFFSAFVLDVELIIETVSHFLPAEYIVPFVEFLLTKQSVNTITGLISMGISFWLASRSNNSFLLISAEREEVIIPKWSIRLLSIVHFFVVSLYVIAATIVITSLNFISPGWMPFVYILAALIGFYLFYRHSSFLDREKSYGIVGALAATIGVMLIGVLFFQIINQYTNYDSVYGPLASLIILFLGIYLIAFVIYFGFIVNMIFAEESSGKLRKSRLLDLCIWIDRNVIERIINMIVNR